MSKPKHVMTAEERKVIFASSLGTIFEWYDFYLYGSLAAIIGTHFFAGVNPTTQFIFALMAFAAGFAVRPFGAIFFGRLGDLLGRKKTFLMTMMVMGLATFIVGILPTYETIGVAAPIILVILRLLQGLALGGEYGGAATYVAEHAPPGQRGYFTSWIQTTATVGLLASLLIILGCRTWLGPDFDKWGWRIPFLISIFFLGFSLWIRMKLDESPAFKKMKEEGKSSGSPLKDAFANWSNLKVVLFSLFGGTAGQAVVWYTGQFYALFFLTQTLKLDPVSANLLIVVSLLIGTPFFIFFGKLSDRIGRKPIVLAGMVIAALTYFPLFHGLAKAVNPDMQTAMMKSPITVVANPETCSFQFDPVGKSQFTSPCDVAKSLLAKKQIPYNNEIVSGTAAQIKIGAATFESYDGKMATPEEKAAFDANLTKAIADAGYPLKADTSKVNWFMAGSILTILVIYVTMVYGPIAAWLVELFPTRIRYTSMSLPYHIGNGWFGGFLPTVSFAMVAATGDVYYGLWYPIVVALVCAVIGFFFLPETKDRELNHFD
jgi:MFS family permease